MVTATPALRILQIDMEAVHEIIDDCRGESSTGINPLRPLHPDRKRGETPRNPPGIIPTMYDITNHFVYKPYDSGTTRHSSQKYKFFYYSLDNRYYKFYKINRNEDGP